MDKYEKIFNSMMEKKFNEANRVTLNEIINVCQEAVNVWDDKLEWLRPEEVMAYESIKEKATKNRNGAVELIDKLRKYDINRLMMLDEFTVWIYTELDTDELKVLEDVMTVKLLDNIEKISNLTNEKNKYDSIKNKMSVLSSWKENRGGSTNGDNKGRVQRK